ncbi:hypothetical protein AVP43_02698 [Geobacillus stearothermophilus]|nr:hypothetical protein GS458_1570 [Geobacillus stearothermophilus]KZE94408.1 hypothetical protein AVP43_02698 [Geobacillus stearothermophilus]
MEGRTVAYLMKKVSPKDSGHLFFTPNGRACSRLCLDDRKKIVQERFSVDQDAFCSNSLMISTITSADFTIVSAEMYS